MNYNEIAVQFNNLTEREQIINKFKSEGFKLAPNIISVNGRMGYSEMCRYVCVLTDYGLEGKKFISFDDFAKESQMKNNLQVSLKIQPDGKTVVAECTHISDELRGKGVLAEKDGYKVRSDYSIALYKDILYVRGEYEERDYIIFSYNFDTPEQAQQYVNIMDELIDEINNTNTDWSKVEVGADVKVKVVKVDCGWTFNCKFKEYVKETNQIIVFNDNKVEVYDASEVELC